MYTKIRNDTFRTLATDEGFKERVGEERLVRLLEAFVGRTLGEPFGGGSERKGIESEREN